MVRLSDIVNGIKPSLTRKLFNMAKGYDNVIDFTLGDPDVPTAQGIKEAGCSAIMQNKTRYSQNAGLLELRQAIAGYNQKKEGLEYDAGSEIIVTVGAMEGLYLALMTLLNFGDEVIIPAPYYVNYKQMVQLCHAVPVIVEDETGIDTLTCSLDAIKSAITQKTKAIILNTPCNPSGRVLSEAYVVGIAEMAKEYNLVVITDEVYKCLIYERHSRPMSIASLPDMKERTIFINSLSKEFCMTGWRIGYVMSTPEVIAAMTKLQENVAACAPLPSQYAAIEALRLDRDYSSEMAQIFSKRRDVLIEELSRVEKLRCTPPEATFYAMVNIGGTGMKSEEFAYALLQSVQVAVVPGVTYGYMCDNYIRIAFTLDEEKIREGIRRIKKFIENTWAKN